MTAALLGLTMGKSNPAPIAWVRKLTVIFSRAGRPKEMLLTPSTVWTPSFSFTQRRARRVSRAWDC